MDKPQEAIHSLEYACKLDPLAIAPGRTLGFAYFFAERYSDVIDFTSSHLEMMPQNWFALSMKAFAVGMLGDWQEALKMFNRVYTISGQAQMAISYLAYCHGRLNQKADALALIARLEEFHSTSPELAKYCDLFIAYWGVGDYDRAFESVDKAIARKEEIVAFIINSPILTGIRKDPRYQESRRKMGFA